jgi:Tfp pilus assembly protein PilV
VIRAPHNKNGFGLVEVIIAAGIISTVIGTLIATTNTFFKSSRSTTSDVKAGYLLEEGVEALKVMRDGGYTANISSLSNNTSYYFSWNGTIWTSTTTITKIDNVFYRTMELGAAYRDGNSDLASTGSLDNDTRKATITVTWFDQGRNGTSTKTLVTYISNIFDN